MKKIEDIRPYLKYYIGQKVETPDGIGILNFVRWENETVNILYGAMGPDFSRDLYYETPILILRKLSDMTEEEEEEYTKTVDEWNFGFKRNMLGAATSTHFLLSRGFDLFNLIESGLAIDSKSLTNQTV